MYFSGKGEENHEKKQKTLITPCCFVFSLFLTPRKRRQYVDKLPPDYMALSSFIVTHYLDVLKSSKWVYSV
jgi:hypothetical protein